MRLPRTSVTLLWARVGVTGALLGLAACNHAAQPPVGRFDAQLTVLADGSMRVQEMFALRVDPGRELVFVRPFSQERHDGVFDLSVKIDGRGISAPSGIVRSVRVPVPAGATTDRVLALEYRVAGAVRVSGIRGRLSWQVLTASRRFDVGTTAIRVTLPPGAALLQDPWVEEAGWNVTRLPDGVLAERSAVPAAESATVGAEFTIDAMAVPEPRWQFVETRAQEFIPAYLSAGLFLLVIGAGVVVMVWARYPRPKARQDAPDVPVPDRLTRALRLGRPWGRGRRRREVLSDLAIEGFIDAERLGVARGLRNAGLVVLMSGVAGHFLVRATLGDYGVWPQAIPASLVVDGVLLVAAAGRFPVLNQAGADAAERLRRQ